MKRLAILGLGLMGGSLGLAVKEKGLVETVSGYARREENRQKALESGAVDEVFDNPADAVKNADMVVCCLPVLVIKELVADCKQSFSEDCIVTDVGSTKEEVVFELSKLFEDIPASFVGSHPMAGSDKSGFDAAKGDLYENAIVVVTSSESENVDALKRVKDFWNKLDAKVIVMDPKQHDRIIARTSHLPHLVAAMLVRNLVRDDVENIGEFCGPGFKDTTRIAGGSEDIWHDIVKSNRVSVGRELEEFGKVLEQLQAMLKEEDFDGIRQFLAECRKVRRDI